MTAGKRLKVKDADLDKYRDILENPTDYPTDEKTGFMVGRGMPFNRNHRHWCHMQMMHPLQWVRVRSLAGEPCRIKPNLPGAVRVSGRRSFSLEDLSDGVYTLDLKKGDEALLYTGDTIPRTVVTPMPAQDGKCNRYGWKE